MLGGELWCRHTTAGYLKGWLSLAGIHTSDTAVGSNIQRQSGYIQVPCQEGMTGTLCTDNTPALHTAVENGNLEMVKYLVQECGADIQQSARPISQSSIWNEVTQLWVATYKERMGAVKCLVSRGARIETMNGSDRRPEVHIAA